MSNSGAYTPLALNTISALTAGQGFTINSTGAALVGIWSPSAYLPGTLLAATSLGALTTKIKTAYLDSVATTISSAAYRSLLLIGTGVCPALGNSRPTTFKPSYPGFGNWTGATLLSDSYPPKNYPTTGTYSYIYQAYGDYAWITGWPGRNPWQKTTDTYAAATVDTPEYDEYFSDGFVATVARQAYYEMWTNQFESTNNIVNSFTQASAYKNSKNSDIGSFVNTKTFMSGVYSNINDLTTSDIAGVNQAFKIWGTDLINLGRTIYLPDIAKFGMPSSLLRNLQRNNSLTDAVKLALIYNELTTSEINNILVNSDNPPTAEQERKIYSAFLLVSGDDLHSPSTGVLYGLNCQTTNLTTLADLLDPLKLFPLSYNSLTLPQYSTTTVSAKIYDFIYTDGGVNSRIKNWGEYLSGILPSSLATACGAFAMTMQQIKFISTMDIQRFSQVVANLELVNLDLPLINTADGVPGSIELADGMLANLALGSGNSGSYRMCDFFGAASGYPYTGYYQQSLDLIRQLTTPALQTIYTTLPTTTDVEIAVFVAAANAEIAAIHAANSQLVDQLNYYWNLIGSQLFKEQRAIPGYLPIADSIPELANSTDMIGFTQQIEQWANITASGQEAKTLEDISDLTVLGGQSIVAAMRESRNASRLVLTGGDLQNNVDPVIVTCGASATPTVVDGKITEVRVTSPGCGGYIVPPSILVLPVGGGAVLQARLAGDGTLAAVDVIDGGAGYTSPQLEMPPPPQELPPNPPQQTYSDTPDSQLVPPNLVSPASASPDVAAAIAEVIHCNCDCWN